MTMNRFSLRVALFSSLIIFSIHFTGCTEKIPEFKQTVKSISDMPREEPNGVVRALYVEAAQYDKSFWQSAKGDVINMVIGRINSGEGEATAIYDDAERLRIVKSGRHTIIIHPELQNKKEQ
jgi:hypothetical protein